MENLLWVYGLAAAMALGVITFRAMRSDETSARRLAKIRVPVNDRSRKRIEEPADEDYLGGWSLAGVAFGISVILLLTLAQAL